MDLRKTTYNIAIIQNEKELIKYDCADWSRNLFEKTALSNYQVSYYDEQNISQLFLVLDEFDSIFISTNSLNNDKVYNLFVEKKEQIEKYINIGHGLFVGYSSKRKDKDFLPGKYYCNQIERQLIEGDSEKDGNPEFTDNELLTLFETTQKSMFQEIYQNHSTVSGFYYDYLFISDKSKVELMPVIMDKDTDRVLMCSSTASSIGRVIITTLPIDWQMQESLLINSIRFCSEGRPHVLIVSKQSHPDKFDFSDRYLCYLLTSKKISFKQTYETTCNGLISKCKYIDTIIFDSNWDDEEVIKFSSKYKKEIYEQNVRILHYLSDNSKVPSYRVVVHSASEDYKLYIRKTINYLLNIPITGVKQLLFYDSSITAVYEAVKLLDEYKKTLPKINNKIVKKCFDRIQDDGSYDSMFVASCNVYALCKICNSQLDNKNWKKLSDYLGKQILHVFSDTSSISIREKAQALYYIIDSEFVKSINIEAVKKKILEELKNTNNSTITSYGISNCWRIITSDRFGDRILAKKLLALSDKYVSCLNDFKQIKTSILSNYVISFCQLLKMTQKYDVTKRLQTNDIIYLRNINDWIFAAMSYLCNVYSTMTSIDDVYSACIFCNAIKEFSQLNLYPVDEVLLLVRRSNENSNAPISMINYDNNLFHEMAKVLVNKDEINNDLQKELNNKDKLILQHQNAFEKMEICKQKSEKKSKTFYICLLISIAITIVSIAIMSLYLLYMLDGVSLNEDKNFNTFLFDQVASISTWCIVTVVSFFITALTPLLINKAKEKKEKKEKEGKEE